MVKAKPSSTSDVSVKRIGPAREASAEDGLASDELLWNNGNGGAAD